MKFDTQSKLKTTLLSRKGTMLQVDLIETGLLSNTHKGDIKISLEDFTKQCSVFGELKIPHEGTE